MERGKSEPMLAAKKARPRVLIVDDDRTQADLLRQVLLLEDLDATSAYSPADALTLAAETAFDVVVSDFRMPGMTGVEFFSALKRLGRNPVFIIITSFGTLETAVEAMREGVHDFATKPIDTNVLLIRIKKALDVRELRNENQTLKSEVAILREKVRIVGESVGIRKVEERIKQVAPSHATILVLGESGTGKELVARSIFAQSPRHLKPYVKLNCTAIPENLLEDELFGHTKGAFTGALGERKGRFEQAHTGTIFLDEIGDLPLHLQPKLLRVLQERELEPVGSNKTIKIDVRLIAATHRDLKQLVREGKFREDLYYRLNVIPITLPPLRERRDDILPLARHFLAKFCEENQRRFRGIARDAEERLLSYSWPGNVRELENCIERAVVLAEGEFLETSDLFAAAQESDGSPIVQRAVDAIFDTGMRLDDFERAIILEALERCEKNLSRTARRLGMTRRSLQYRVEKIREGDGKAPADESRPEGEDAP